MASVLIGPQDVSKGGFIHLYSFIHLSPWQPNCLLLIECCTVDSCWETSSPRNRKLHTDIYFESECFAFPQRASSCQAPALIWGAAEAMET